MPAVDFWSMMAEKMAEKTSSPNQPSAQERQRALGILAKSLYRELTAQGYEQKHIVNLATALLGELTAAKIKPTHS